MSVDTTAIETAVNTACNEIDDLRVELRDTRAQRDELLAALNAMMKYYDTPSGPSDLLAQASTAIANAASR